jgi:hypothetical protein
MASPQEIPRHKFRTKPESLLTVHTGRTDLLNPPAAAAAAAIAEAAAATAAAAVCMQAKPPLTYSQIQQPIEEGPKSFKPAVCMRTPPPTYSHIQQPIAGGPDSFKPAL